MGDSDPHMNEPVEPTVEGEPSAAERRVDAPPPTWGTESHDDRMGRLLKKARHLPRAPGVYLMKDHTGVVQYIGKAGSLRSRVSSYFVPSAELGAKKQGLLDVVHDFEIVETESEVEALLAEARLIKDTRPRFNARLTDDKTFPYLAITMRDDFPGVYITRSPSDPEFKGAKVLGPFTSVYALREALQLLQKAFKFRTCHLDIAADDPKNDYFRPCLLHPIGQCTAPCANKISKEAYRADIDRFVRFLGSKRSAMLREMRQEMEQASKSLEFERAAALRDQIQAIEKLDDRAKRSDKWQPETESFYVDPEKGLASLRKTLGLEEPIRVLEAIDIAHLAGGETVGSKVCFVDGRPLKNEYRRYRIRSVDNDDYMAIREVVSRRYREAGAGNELYPDVILIDGGLGQVPRDRGRRAVAGLLRDASQIVAAHRDDGQRPKVARVLGVAILDLTAALEQVIGASAPLGARGEVARLHHDRRSVEDVGRLPQRFVAAEAQGEAVGQRVGEDVAVVATHPGRRGPDGDRVSEEDHAIDVVDVLIVRAEAVAAHREPQAVVVDARVAVDEHALVAGLEWADIVGFAGAALVCCGTARRGHDGGGGRLGDRRRRPPFGAARAGHAAAGARPEPGARARRVRGATALLRAGPRALFGTTREPGQTNEQPNPRSATEPHSREHRKIPSTEQNARAHASGGAAAAGNDESRPTRGGSAP